MGLNELISHDLVHSYPVLVEKSGDLVAQFKYTIAVRKEGPMLICGSHTLDLTKYQTENKITDDEVLKLLSVFIKYLN
jgi:hypothetical protein